jgi:uncharacterized protein YggT (Ycf19 family)
MRSIISAIVGIITLLVGLRFAMLLFGVNPDIPLVSWIYHVSAPLVAPFSGIINPFNLSFTGLSVQSVLDWSALIALFVYSIVGSILVRLLGGAAHHAH